MIQREIEDNLSEKILFDELKAGQIVTVDVRGARPQAQLTFKGVPKPDEWHRWSRGMARHDVPNGGSVRVTPEEN
jgi:hypothetical protein